MLQEHRDTAELTDLVGLHTLTAVSMDPPATVAHFAPDASVINFELDGVSYTAVEDPSDGYRSSMDVLIKGAARYQLEFPPCQVFCYTESTDYFDPRPDILTMRDVVTGKIVLQVGTYYADDYYPTFVARWMPENMAANQERGDHHVSE